MTADGLVAIGSAKKPLTNGNKSGIIKSEEVEMVALENQRYGRNKDTLVNKTYIDGGEYKRKFDNATDNPEVNKSLYDCSKTALKHRSGTSFEDMYWIDSETGRIVAKEIDGFDIRQVNYSPKTRKVVDEYPKGKLITVHTHPSSMPPSAADFNSSFINGYKCGFIACHDGKVFGYTSEQMISEELYSLYIGQYIATGASEFETQIKALQELSKNHLIDFWEVQ